MKTRTMIATVIAVSFSGLVLATNNDTFDMPSMMMGNTHGMMSPDSMLEQHEKFSTNMQQMHKMSQKDWGAMLALHTRIHGEDRTVLHQNNDVEDDELIGD